MVGRFILGTVNELARLPVPERLRLRAEDFELLEGNDAFADYAKAELIDGDIYVTSPQFSRHGLAKVDLIVALANRLEAIGSDLKVFSEVSIRVAIDSMLEPDIFLAPRRGYGAVPVASIALIVEIADTTLDTDLGRKAVLYAAAGVPEYWVVDLNNRRVLVHTHPATDGYHERSQVPLGESLLSTTVDGLAIETTTLID